MRAWFFGLQMRERSIVGVGASVAVAIILWGFVVRPMRAEVAALRTAVDTKQRLLVDVARVEGSRPSGARQSPGSRANARRHRRQHRPQPWPRFAANAGERSERCRRHAFRARRSTRSSLGSWCCTPRTASTSRRPRSATGALPAS